MSAHAPGDANLNKRSMWQVTAEVQRPERERLVHPGQHPVKRHAEGMEVAPRIDRRLTILAEQTSMLQKFGLPPGDRSARLAPAGSDD